MPPPYFFFSLFTPTMNCLFLSKILLHKVKKMFFIVPPNGKKTLKKVANFCFLIVFFYCRIQPHFDHEKVLGKTISSPNQKVNEFYNKTITPKSATFFFICGTIKIIFQVVIFLFQRFIFSFFLKTNILLFQRLIPYLLVFRNQIPLQIKSIRVVFFNL